MSKTTLIVRAMRIKVVGCVTRGAAVDKFGNLTDPLQILFSDNGTLGPLCGPYITWPAPSDCGGTRRWTGTTRRLWAMALVTTIKTTMNAILFQHILKA